MADRFRSRAANESLPRVPKEPSLGDGGYHALAGGLEVLQRCTMKAQQGRAHRQRKPFQLLTRAIEIDPQFAMAYAQLGRPYAALGESELGARNIAKAYELRNRVSDRENYFNHVQLPPAGNQKPGSGATDPGIVGPKVPRGICWPTVSWRPSRRRGRAITRKPRKKVKRRSDWIRITPSATS
jgi:hypothetical protein